MKKIIKYLCILLICIIGINGVSAEDEVILNKYGMYCQYGEYYFIYSGFSLNDTFEFDTNFDQLGISIEDGRPGKAINDEIERKWLTDKKLITSDGQLSCPIDPFGLKLGAVTNKACGKENCILNNIINSYEQYTCNYVGQSSKKSLSIKYKSDENGVQWDITYPDGTNKVLINTQVSGNFMPSKDCKDIYYDLNNNTIHVALDANKNITDNLTLSGFCKKYNGNIEKIEHFCSGNCDYKEIVCPNYNFVSCGDLEDIPAALPVFIKNIINIVKIAVPVILIIMGMLDFAKAVISNDEKGMKESQNKFIKRIIAAIAIFLIVSIVQFIFKIINTNDTNTMVSCIDCFISGNCSAGSNVQIKKTCESYSDSCPLYDDYGNECVKTSYDDGMIKCKISTPTSGGAGGKYEGSSTHTSENGTTHGGAGHKF